MAIAKGKIRTLAVTAISIASVMALSGLGASGAYAGITRAAEPAAVADAYGGVHVTNHDGLCLGISGGTDKAPAGQYKCDHHPDQYWHWRNSKGGYHQLVNGDNECLGVSGGSDKYGARIVGWKCNGHPDQYWATYLVNEGGTTWQDFADYDPLSNGGEAVLGISGGSTAVGAAAVQWIYTAAPNQLWHSG
jgi:NADPH:quinone reductase-like Zn-dependent oxidoreductase